MAPKRGKLLLAAVLAVMPMVGTVAGAQEDSSRGLSSDRAMIERVLHDRGREVLHPSSDPTRIIGLEESGHGYRERTPALLNSDRQVAMVDLDELYERKLALYEGGPKSTRPLTVERRDDVSPTRSERGPAKPAVTQETQPSESSGNWFWGPILAVILVSSYLVFRKPD